jgi:hypothetical protein
MIYGSSRRTSRTSTRPVDVLDFGQVQRIFRRPEFRAGAPGKLLEFVMQRHAAGGRFAGLFEFVDFAAVSHEALAAFAKRSEELLESLNQSTWDRISAPQDPSEGGGVINRVAPGQSQKQLFCDRVTLPGGRRAQFFPPLQIRPRPGATGRASRRPNTAAGR